MIDVNKNIKGPIGVFDSGLGGLSVWKEINMLLPNESTIYLADSKNAPYGEKSKEQIIEFSVKNTELLLQKGCKIIVVACNTATTNAIKVLRERYDVPFVGIEPAIKPATLITQSGRIGILATKGTLSSELFNVTSDKYRKNFEILEVEGKGLVKLIEKGEIEETKELLKQYLYPMIERGVDSIVLGCTHYPFLTSRIKDIIPSNVQVIDSGKAVALQTKNILENNFLTTESGVEPENSFYTNNNVEIFKNFVNEMDLNLQTQVEFKDF